MEEGAAFAVIARDHPREKKSSSSSYLCSLCGDAGFPEALLPCRARGCARVQHTYCGRYCPEMLDDAGRWRCEWCARKKARRIVHPLGDDDSSSSSPSPPPFIPLRDQAAKSSSTSPTTRATEIRVTNRALDRWRTLAKRTRLGGKKYKLLADVLCISGSTASERTSTTPTAS